MLYIFNDFKLPIKKKKIGYCHGNFICYFVYIYIKYFVYCTYIVGTYITDSFSMRLWKLLEKWKIIKLTRSQNSNDFRTNFPSKKPLYPKTPSHLLRGLPEKLFGEKMQIRNKERGKINSLPSKIIQVNILRACDIELQYHIQLIDMLLVNIISQCDDV